MHPSTLSVFLAALFFAVVAPQTRAGQPGPATRDARPNVIMIFCDDMGYGDISSFTDSPQKVATPNIDRLAKEGMKFNQFYVASPVCSPSRAAVLSGRFASETGLTNFLHTREHNRKNDQDDFLDPALGHLPRAFNDAGYATAHIGKWHVGGGRDVDNAPSISAYGYDHYVSTFESPDPDPKLGIHAPWTNRRSEGQVREYERTPYKVDRTLEFLRQHKAEPVFITLWTNDLHADFHPSPAMQKKHGGTDQPNKSYENFLGVLEEYDREIGRLLDGIAQLGLDQNTIIFFTGDNGAGPHADRRSAGLRGGKLTLYEGGIREPFIIRWPAAIRAGTVNDATVLCAVDLLPTLTALAGIPLSPDAKSNCDGEDLSAAMRGQSPHRTGNLYWENGQTRPENAPRGPSLAIRHGDWKLLVNHDGTDTELYQLREDPNETTNRAAEHPDLVKTLSTEITRWARSLPHRTHP